MIKCDGTKVMIAGSGIEILQDFVNITKGVRGVIKENVDSENADEIIGLCGRLAYCSDEAEEDMYMSRLVEIMLGRKVDKS